MILWIETILQYNKYWIFKFHTWCTNINFRERLAVVRVAFSNAGPFVAMAEGNGELLLEESMKIDLDSERTEDYHKLLEYGLDEKVAAKLDEIYKTGKLAHVDLDERALDALKEFPVDGALNVLGQCKDT